MQSARTGQHPVNQWPVNKLAQKWLLQAKAPGLNSQVPYLVQLMWLGFEEDLAVPGQGQKYRGDLELAAGELLSPRLNPLQVMRWFLGNPDGPPEPEQSRNLEVLLREAPSWEEAAQECMELLYDRLAAQNPLFRGGESRG